MKIMFTRYSKYGKKIFKLVVSAIFLFWVIYVVDWATVLKNVQSIKPFYLVIYTLSVLAGMVICAYKWKLLAEFKKIEGSFGSFFKYYLAGTFVNNFMPSFIGGDTFKAYETGKLQGRYIEAASAVMMDRITGLFGATILAMVFTLINFKNVINNTTLIIVNLLVLLSFTIDIFTALFKKSPLWSRFEKYLPEKIAAFITNVGSYSNHPKVFKKAVLLSFAFDFIGIALSNYILFMALNIKIDLINYLSIIFLISIIASVPISINNIGIKEWAYITFFGAFGLTASSVVTVAIVSRFIQMFISFFALPVYLKRTRK